MSSNTAFEMDESSHRESQSTEVEVNQPSRQDLDVDKRDSDDGHQLESTPTAAEEPGPSTGRQEDRVSAQEKRKERMQRLRELHLRRNEARKLNHAEVVEEDRRNKLPANWEARKRKAEWELADSEARKQAEEDGEDYERVKLLEESATEAEKRDRKKKKKNPDTGFADFAQAQFRQYERLTKQLEPDLEAYEKQKQELGEDFYPGVNTLLHGGSGKVSQAGIDRMVGDLEKQIEKRSKFSRRRAYNPDADVDYINERNKKFNKKAARFYDQYTAEIKQNLERGTAV